LQSIDIQAQASGALAEMRQQAATGITVANLFLITGVFGTLVGLYQAAKQVATQDAAGQVAKLDVTLLGGAFSAFGVTIAAITGAAFALLVTSALRGRLAGLEGGIKEQIERYLNLHRESLGGELSRRLTAVLDRITGLFEQQFEQIGKSQVELKEATNTLSALLGEFGGFRQLTDALHESIKKMDRALKKSLETQEKTWEDGLAAQRQILESSTNAIKDTLDEAVARQKQVMDQSAEALTASNRTAAMVLSDAVEAGRAMVNKSTESLNSALTGILDKIKTVGDRITATGTSFEEATKLAGDKFNEALVQTGDKFNQALGQIKYDMENFVKEWKDWAERAKRIIENLTRQQTAQTESAIRDETQAFVHQIKEQCSPLSSAILEMRGPINELKTALIDLVEQVKQMSETATAVTRAVEEQRVAKRFEAPSLVHPSLAAPVERPFTPSVPTFSEDAREGSRAYLKAEGLPDSASSLQSTRGFDTRTWRGTSSATTEKTGEPPLDSSLAQQGPAASGAAQGPASQQDKPSTGGVVRKSQPYHHDQPFAVEVADEDRPLRASGGGPGGEVRSQPASAEKTGEPPLDSSLAQQRRAGSDAAQGPPSQQDKPSTGGVVRKSQPYHHDQPFAVEVADEDRPLRASGGGPGGEVRSQPPSIPRPQANSPGGTSRLDDAVRRTTPVRPQEPEKPPPRQEPPSPNKPPSMDKPPEPQQKQGPWQWVKSTVKSVFSRNKG
jgi:CRISPR/Cas system CSM-associated protein Csm2 small subunit